MFVLDCSVAVCWFVKNQASAETDRLLEQLHDNGALVPALWHWELGNVLVRAERRGFITAAQLTATLENIKVLITTDTRSSRALNEVLNLARVESLTTYDAAYLDLAMQREIPLATLDEKLIRAARRNKVKTLPV
ncbi:MAG: type II toxin-antitoxin system VapC family toxin [Gammaproteobacteria bacterium]|nr:type II toxin-antitoxin system VapC family toxin [Gammaproteobacteria bacterium]MDD9800255.1 type II toxin-antitoxin system VapC family toxin [Gammaproteobacteria bacterium]MDD9815690.1 type II toxin-antitoxin system VapC family toxin [Gammaproteobacteria bacterium]MDD9851495.1 type II toxin-antitoxin system VapC family toxin [Gammaproteobacteria bacterium]MDD9869985.1 type II toxin-antitoxin system VapC family toxin [Gammaproteobacteria bacterium]